MKELLNLQRDTEKQSIEAQVNKQQEKEYKLEETIKPHRGHKVWAINVKTLEVKEASFKKEEVLDFMDYAKGKIADKSRKEIAKEKNTVYVSALNQSSALKRYRNGKGSAVVEFTNEDIESFF